MLSNRSFLISIACAALAAPFLVNCSSTKSNAQNAGSAATVGGDMVDCQEIAGVPGLLPKDDSLSPMQQIGRCTWALSTARTTNNPNFSVDAAGNPTETPEGLTGTESLAHSITKKNGTVVPFFDVVLAKSEQDRVARWKNYGLMNDPGCVAATAPDQYGLWLDTCVDPNSAGTVGLRKFPNPAFDDAAKQRWMGLLASGEDKLQAAIHTDATLESPWLLGQACGNCHTSFDPAHPPADPAHPKWENLKFSLGNQYLREGNSFKGSTNGPTDFRWHVLDTQEPGTSDTSRIASDHINNPNSINTIMNLLFRPWHTDKLKAGQVTFDLTASVCPDLTTTCADTDKVPVTSALALLQPNQSAKAIASLKQIVKTDGEPHKVQSILKGAEDSVGPVGALLRVYLNIGMCADMWMSHFDPINGMSHQTEIKSDELYNNCPSYQQMLNRVPAIFLFLATQGPINLKDSPGGAAHINDDLANQGKIVFANNCASCHSSKQPPPGTPDAAAWFRDAIQQDDWLVGNFLSDDTTHPVTEIGTNLARALDSNHMKGNVFNVHASQNYEERTWPGAVTVDNPYGSPINYTGPNGGPGYYRTPTLVSVWSRAPLFHNRALGAVDPTTNQMVVPGPGVDDRVAAFEDAIKMMLSPELRPKTTANGHQYPGYVKTTSQDSMLSFNKFGIPFTIHVPSGTPVNLLANLDPNALRTQAVLASLAITDKFWSRFDPNQRIPGDLLYPNAGSHLMAVSLSPDLVENRGHEFGSDLPQTDKDALLEYLKTL